MIVFHLSFANVVSCKDRPTPHMIHMIHETEGRDEDKKSFLSFHFKTPCTVTTSMKIIKTANNDVYTGTDSMI